MLKLNNRHLRVFFWTRGSVLSLCTGHKVKPLRFERDNSQAKLTQKNLVKCWNHNNECEYNINDNHIVTSSQASRHEFECRLSICRPFSQNWFAYTCTRIALYFVHIRVCFDNTKIWRQRNTVLELHAFLLRTYLCRYWIQLGAAGCLQLHSKWLASALNFPARFPWGRRKDLFF